MFSGFICLSSLLVFDDGVSGRLVKFKHSSEVCVSPSEEVKKKGSKLGPSSSALRKQGSICGGAYAVKISYKFLYIIYFSCCKFHANENHMLVFSKHFN